MVARFNVCDSNLVSLSVRLAVCLTVCLSVSMSDGQPVCFLSVSLCPSVCLSVSVSSDGSPLQCLWLEPCISVWPYACLPPCLPVYLSAFLSVCLFMCLPACLSFFLPLWLSCCIVLCVCLSLRLSFCFYVSRPSEAGFPWKWESSSVSSVGCVTEGVSLPSSGEGKTYSLPTCLDRDL